MKVKKTVEAGIVVVGLALLLVCAGIAHGQWQGGSGTGSGTVTTGAGLTGTGSPGSPVALSAPVSAANGGTGVASPTAHRIPVAEGASAVALVALATDQLLQGTTGADPAGVTIPNCAADAGHGLIYSTTSHAFTCQAITAAGVGAVASAGSGAVNGGSQPVNIIGNQTTGADQLKGVSVNGVTNVQANGLVADNKELSGDLAIVDQPLSQGDGTTTAFIPTNNHLVHCPITPGSLTIHAGSITGTDDGAGNITGTGIAAGSTVGYAFACAVTLNFTVAPAMGTVISASYTPADVTTPGGASMTAASNLVTAPAGTFSPTDVNKLFYIDGVSNGFPLTAEAAGNPIIVQSITYPPKFVKSETVFAGNGATTTVSSHYLNNRYAGPGTVRVFAVIGGTICVATDNGQGTITNVAGAGTLASAQHCTGFSTGTIDYVNGIISLTYNTAPDSGTNVTVQYFTHKLLSRTIAYNSPGNNITDTASEFGIFAPGEYVAIEDTVHGQQPWSNNYRVSAVSAGSMTFGGPLSTTITSYVSSSQVRVGVNADVSQANSDFQFGTDNYTALHTLANTLSSSNGGQVNLSFPAGHYGVSNQINFGASNSVKGIHIVGAGRDLTYIKQYAMNTPLFQFGIGATTQSVKDMTVEDSGIFVAADRGFSLIQLAGGGGGTTAGASSLISNTEISGMRIAAGAITGISGGYNQRIHIHNNIFDYRGRAYGEHAIYMSEGSRDIEIDHNIMQSNGFNSSECVQHNGGLVDTPNSVTRVIIDHNICRGFSIGILPYGGNAGIIDDWHLDSNIIDGRYNGYTHITSDDTTTFNTNGIGVEALLINSSITNNDISGFSQNGIFINSAPSGCFNCQISGNRIHDNGATGILFSSAEKSAVFNNTIYDENVFVVPAVVSTQPGVGINMTVAGPSTMPTNLQSLYPGLTCDNTSTNPCSNSISANKIFSTDLTKYNYWDVKDDNTSFGNLFRDNELHRTIQGDVTMSLQATDFCDNLDPFSRRHQIGACSVVAANPNISLNNLFANPLWTMNFGTGVDGVGPVSGNWTTNTNGEANYTSWHCTGAITLTGAAPMYIRSQGAVNLDTGCSITMTGQGIGIPQYGGAGGSGGSGSSANSTATSAGSPLNVGNNLSSGGIAYSSSAAASASGAGNDGGAITAIAEENAFELGPLFKPQGGGSGTAGGNSGATFGKGAMPVFIIAPSITIASGVTFNLYGTPGADVTAINVGSGGGGGGADLWLVSQKITDNGGIYRYGGGPPGNLTTPSISVVGGGCDTTGCGTDGRVTITGLTAGGLDASLMTITNAGSGYKVAPVCQVNAGTSGLTGTPACHFTISGGAIASIVIDTPGSGGTLTTFTGGFVGGYGASGKLERYTIQ